MKGAYNLRCGVYQALSLARCGLGMRLSFETGGGLGDTASPHRAS